MRTKTATPNNSYKSSYVLPAIRRHLRVPVANAIAACFVLWSVQAQSATNNWTANSTTDFNWANAANWSLGAPTAADLAVFGTPIPNPGALANPHILTLSGGSVASALSLKDNYTLTGGDLTLTSGAVRADLGVSSTINSQLLGAAGLTLTGGGSVRLTNSLNGYTGTTTIANGSLIISNQAQLGADTSAISILTTNQTPLNNVLYGYGGGSLVLDGTSSGFTFSRAINFEGRGPIGDRGAAIQSLGNNTLSGVLNSAVSPLPLSPTASIRNSRINSVNGTLTLSGTVDAGGTSATTFLNFGGVNSAGTGNFDLNGVLSGTGSIEKSGGGTLLLNPSSTSGFGGTVRISGSGTGQESTVRVTQLTAGSTSIFGTNTISGDDPSAIDMNGGVLEFRNEGNLNFNSLSSGKNVYQRASSTYFTGPGVGGQGLNGTTTLGTFRVASNTTATFNNRNGYGFTLQAWTQENSNNNFTVTNNMGGTLLFTGNAWNNSDGTARTLTFGGNGNTTINGFINATVSAHTLSKTGSGVLTIKGQGTSTLAAVNVQGSLAITDFRSINNNTSNLSLGNAGTTAGNLIIGTDLTPTAAGLTTSRLIVLSTTTVSPSIYANQPGSNPVILNGAINRTAQTTGGLILGGTNTADNIINVGIPNAGTGGLLKTGSGTWVLAGANAYTGATNIVNGTLKLKANAASSTIFAATHDITFGNSNVFAGGTLEFVGQNGVNNVQTLDVLTTTSGASTIRLTPAVGGTASLTFASQATGAAGTVNFVGADFVNNKITITGANGLVSRTNYWEGANFAYRESNVLRAPVYGTDTGFTTSSSALTAAANMEITGSFATNTLSISTLKIAGSHTLTLNAAQTVTLSNGGVLVTGGDAIITGGTALALGSQALVVRTNLDTDSLDIQSVITGTAGLTKGGAGTLILSNANNQTGTVTINEGTIQLSGSGRLGAAADLTMRQGTLLDLNGVTPSTNTNAYNGNGSVTSATAATFTVGGSNGTGTSFGTVDGAISLTKIGTGGQSWLGNSTYTGVTTIGSTGTVTVETLADIGQDSGIGRGNATSDATNAASLVFNGTTGGLVYAGNIRDGELILGSRSTSTNRLFTLAGSGATLSSTASNNNAIVWSNTGAIVHGVTGPQALTFTGTSTGDNTFSPQLTDSGTGTNITSLTKASTGQWNLGNSNNIYTGATTISDGVLGLTNNGALSANSPLVLGTTTTSGILQMSGTFARNLTATPTAGTGTLTWGGTTGGGGFAAHTTPLTVTLDGGAGLNWGSGGFVGTGGTQALIFGSASALSDVTFTNAIDLGAAVRTITVNANGNTGTDYATLSGVLSGTGGGILKNGAAPLRLTGANTYTGTTNVDAGTIVVSSLGSSTGPATSSVGASGVTMDNTNAIVLGNATTTGGLLQYVGPGETSDRKIRLRGTTAGNQIHADGSGPLILTNVAHDTTETGDKTLSLRGSNTAGNMITSALTNNGAGVLSVTVDGGATWILTNPGNTYTGTTTAGAGALGIGHNSAIGTGKLIFSNGNVFGYGGDRIITNAIDHNNNSTAGFFGDYSLTFTQPLNWRAAGNNMTTSNSVAAGKTVTFTGGVNNTEMTANRAWAIDGTGETVINGDITTTTAFGLRFDINGGGTLNLGTNGATSNWNQGITAVDVDRGTLKFSANNAIPILAATNGGITLSPELATADTATINLNGTNQTINALTATTDGAVMIDNTSASPATFTFGANNTTVSITNNGARTITDSGAGALSIVKTGNTALTLPTGMTLTYQGTTSSTGGGSFTINSALNGTSGLIATGNSSLALPGGLTDPGAITRIEVGGGSTLSLLDGTGSAISNLNNLNLGAGSGTATLNFNIGDGATDTLTLLTGGALTLGNTITFNMTDAGLSPITTYTLLNLTDGGLTAFGIGNIIQGATPGGFTAPTWTVTDNIVQITTGTLITGASWWNAGGTLDNWNDVANWAITDKTGATPAASIPGQGTDVIFIADNIAGGAAIATTLEQNFKVNSLTFEASTNPANTPASVTINPGTITTSRLEVAPQVATDGIKITAGGPPAVTISAPLRLGANQTWNVADAASVLTLSGGLQGEKDVTKTGSGKVTISIAADNAFNSGNTADFTVNGGNLEILSIDALGVTGKRANIAVNTGGAFYYNNATAGTVTNALTLGGGTLSAGGNNQTYSGTVNISGNSFINMADSNGPNTNAARNITLSGAVSGSGNLTIDSNNTVSGGNQLGGTLTLNNAANSWTGDLFFNEGTVTLTNATSSSFTANDVTFNAFGRLNLQGLNGATLTRSGTLNYAAGAIGEFGVDNTGAVVNSDYLVNQNGLVTLGAGGTGGNMRIFLADAFSKMNITGGVTLGGNSSISVGGDALGVVEISSVISDGGSGYALAINDDFGGWATTNRTARLTNLNTFLGNFALGEGIAEFNTVTGISGAASSLGQGTAITIGGGNLRFIGSASQSTNRPITTTASSTLSAHGTGGASITYTGAITQALDNALTLSGTGNTTVGFITGGITQVGVTADVSVNSGNWTISGAPSVLADDIIVTNASAVLNLNGASLISFTAGTSNGLYSRAGATINLLSNDIFGPLNSGSLDFILLGDNSTGGAFLNTNTFSIETPRLDLGQRTNGYEAQIDGTGTVFVRGGAIDLFRGTVNANLASDGSTAFEKISTGTVTLKGDNSGLASTGSSIVYEGTLLLDYTASNTTKLRAASALDMRGGSLVLDGNASTASAQTVASFTLGSGGNSTITLNPGAGKDLVLNLNAITRAVNAQDGTIRFNLPSGTQSATNGITTDTLNTIGTGANAILGGWATVNDGTGVFFARNTPNTADGNIGAAVTTSTDAVASWLTGENISDSSGFTGTLSSAYINSLRYNAASGSDVSLTSTGVLGINSGGILVTSNVGATPSLMNGTIFSGAQASNVPELIINQDSAAVFEIGADLRTNSAFTKSGAGTVRLSGNNTYTGGTEIQDGILQLSGGSAIGDTSLVTLATYRPTTLQLLANETIGRLQGGQRQTDSDNGMVDVGSHTLTINQSASTTYSGRFSGSGTIVLNAGSTGNLNYNGQTSTGLFTGSVVVNGGLFQISGDTARLGSATAFTINGAGNFLLDNDADANVNDRISDTATFTLNSAAGPFSGTTIVRGLAIRNNDNDDSNETIGLTTFNSGTNYLSLEASGGTSAQARIISTDWVRNNSATVNVRGRNLGATADAAGRTQFKVQDANDGAMLAANVGGGGVIGGTAKNVSIIPWAIGESLTAGLVDGNMGNTFLSYVDNRGFVPLSLNNEFSTFSAAASGDNVRESLGADLTGIAGATVNSLILNNTAFAGLDVTGTGAGQTLAITSGALMFTVTGGAASTAYDTTLGGFGNGITIGSTNEYVIHVVNPSSAATTSTLTATIASPLTSSADITKAGRGTLILNQVNTAGGGANKTTLNEGTLEIGDLDHIGGSTGSLVFAGGTLRLGAGLTDDISTRTISFQLGGGTLDTNGIDLALANSLGSGAGAFTKLGVGNVTLNATSTRTGATTITTGTITIGAANALGVGGNLSIGAGTTLALGANNISQGLVATSGASPAITGTGTITASTGFSLNHTGDTTIDAILAGAGGLLKSQSNVVTLTGANSYTGTTEVQAGGLAFSSIGNVGGGVSSLGNPANAEAAIIRMGLSTAATSLTYTGSGHSTDRLIAMQGTTGGVTLSGSGAGAIIYTSGVRFENAGNKTLTLRGTSDPAILNQIGMLTEAGGVLTLNKSDANTWIINGGNTYTGATQIDDGTLRMGAANVLPATTVVRVGSGTTVGTLDLNGFNQTVASLSSASNSTSQNTVLIPTGTTLTTSSVVLSNNTDGASTNLTMSGGGALVVNGTSITVGNNNGGTNLSSKASLNLAALGSFSATLTGNLTVQQSGDNNAADNASLVLSDTANTITTPAVIVGGSSTGSVNTLNLGAGTNVINADLVHLGSGTRDTGVVNFAGAAGGITLRNTAGTGRANVTLGVSTAQGTGYTTANNFDVNGHTADLAIGTLATSLGAKTANNTNDFKFNQGTLDILTINMAAAKGTGTSVNKISIGGGTALIGGSAAFSDTGTGTATLATAGSGELEITGGTVTSSVAFVRGVGTGSATVTLNGGTLNMSSQTIGTAALPITLAAASGTLNGLAELNGGGVLNKTTAGTLVVGDGNAYTGGTSVTAGTLLATNTTGSATGTGAVTVDLTTTLAGNGSIAPASGKSITLNGTTVVGTPGSSTAEDFAMTVSGAANLALNGTIKFDIFANANTGSLNPTLTSNDLLTVSAADWANVIFGATAVLKVETTLLTTSWAQGDAWKIFDWSGITTGTVPSVGSGGFAPANIDLPALTGGQTWNTSQLYTTGVISIELVPEPSRMILLLIGLLGACFRRRRSNAC